jgi:hypothetical protein
MNFTVELRYQSGSSTVLSTEAETADQALQDVRDPRRPLVGIHITAPGSELTEAPEERRYGAPRSTHRVPVRHRPSRRH